MNQSIWVKKFFIFAISIITFVSLVNYIINPFSTFNHPLDSYFAQKTNIVSDRMSKFYAANHLKPKTILIGTSRSGFFKESQLAPYVIAPIYNYSMAGSSVDEQAAYIQYMITQHKLKTVVWSLDFFSFNPTKPMNPSFDPERFKHPIYWKDYEFSLFSFKTLSRSFKTVQNNLFSTIEEIPHGQPYTPERLDFNIKYILHQYATEKSFLASESFKNPHSIDHKLDLVQQTLNMCEQYNVNCILYTSPVYYRHIDMIYSIGLGETFEYWKKGLASISPYTDFCTRNSVTVEKMNFTDSSHILGSFGDLVFGRIFHNPTVTIPNDFGIFINNSNILLHLTKERKMRLPFSFDDNSSLIQEPSNM